MDARRSLLLLGLCGCNAVLGLDATHRRDANGDVDTGGSADASACAPIGHDEDADGVDDACDDCPATSDPAQVDGDHDGVGDACDPHPGSSGDVIAFFEPFAPGTDSGWTSESGAWIAQDDAYLQTDTTATTGLILHALPQGTQGDVTIEARATVLAVDPRQGVESPAFRGFGVWFDATGAQTMSDPDGHLAQLVQDLAALSPTSYFGLYVFKGGASSQLSVVVTPSAVPTQVSGLVRAQRNASGTVGAHAEHADLALGSLILSADGDDVTFSSGEIGLRTIRAAVRFESVIVYGQR